MEGKILSEDRAFEEYDAGLQRITVELVDALNAIGVRIAQADVTYQPTWMPGRRNAPESIRLVISPDVAPAAKLDLDRQLVEDCWEGLDRPEVRRTIQELVAEYQRVLSEG